MTAFVYVNTTSQVGDRDHIKVFANQDAAEGGLQRTIPKALLRILGSGMNRPPGVNRRANLDDYDDQPTLRFSADSFPRFAAIS